VERLRLLFESCGLPCRVSPDITLDRWKKLIWNVGFNAVCALTQLTAQGVLAGPEGEALVREAMLELTLVAQARGIALSPEMAGQNIALTRKLGAIVPSMAQDVARGKPTEIEEMNGLVVRLGEAAGVPTPVNRTLTRLIHLVQAKVESLDGVRAARAVPPR
jgi:2-dehydropantoate 2-reductase